MPKREARELKELTRYRISIVEERAREYNRLDKVLQGANIKLSSVASTIDTKSGFAMCKALSEGITDENVLAAMAMGTLKSKEEDLRPALKGLIQPHQRLMLKSILTHIDFLNEQIAELDKEIEQRLSEESELIELLDEITGVGDNRRNRYRHGAISQCRTPCVMGGVVSK
ncbi:hypothetical protein FACS1894187_25720 [Synergistales bacterium]|nr:hypothetical protein FACS1894187_25720 [Synergistales bacterium]